MASFGVSVMLKEFMQQPRPESSCLANCGMPSAHSSYAIGMWILLFGDFVLRRRELQAAQQVTRTTMLTVALLPVAWSEIELGDTSPRQSLAGVAVGVGTALVWSICLGPCCGAFLAKVLPEQAHTYAREPVLDLSLLELQGAGSGAGGPSVQGTAAGHTIQVT
eukprot:CAMPEP_0117544626 /NCGR_PEP_ID=MMETSP0784-20121206/45670_1 /TAXON_ID=39447 /ORGANISM="" /LENGTH=163 /DNA_ID=CAMNT_0005341435 /DNA_START=328 /DNA_END=819 /DNA_ORIENTATION=-